ncbi:hypothetical protein NL108_011993 [Boleophthalmus pectinirostris]|uniref:B-type lectin plumieribetin-like n=1 Tax=Boleophthalmus pectinirostris TaxID=150288 RepID=UPI0024320B1A|nr:B-type lectin plumieribetin-like [Boleophthalmus pectinirostris]KAJ0050099.1 hypothetical protein NL108_011993 [Boleophthalmus pectinirostris]
MSKSSISTDQELRIGDSLISNNRNFKAVFQVRGLLSYFSNFVLYKWSPVWATNTVGKDPYRIILQSDTNLVMYMKKNTPVWDTKNHEIQPCKHLRLILTDQGRLQVEHLGS